MGREGIKGLEGKRQRGERDSWGKAPCGADT